MYEESQIIWRHFADNDLQGIVSTISFKIFIYCHRLLITATGIVAMIVISYYFPSRTLSDNPIKEIGIRAFSISTNKLVM